MRPPYAIVAVPLLVETDFGSSSIESLVVDCPEHLQLERLMRRDAIPRAEAARDDRARRPIARRVCAQRTT